MLGDLVSPMSTSFLFGLDVAGLEGDAAALAEFAGAVEADRIVLNILL